MPGPADPVTASPREHHHAGRTPHRRGVSGSPGSVHALRLAADLARHHDATLIPLLA
jgi:hypothetical protein